MKQDIIELDHLRDLLVGSRKVLIGVSGGADSMALLHSIVRNRKKLSNDFKVLHVDHQINPESSAWGRIVEDYCQENGMPCEVIRVDLDAWGNNLEQAARKARYDAFAKQDCDAILLAHHANDQVETFFLKLFRGSGVKGLRCMSEVSSCWFDESKKVIRPLLSVSRDVIEGYVAAHGIPFVTDPSNVDLRYDRNWVRHGLIPMLKERNEIIDMNVLRSVSIQNETYGLLSDLAEMDLRTSMRSDGSIDWTKLKNLTLPRLKNVIMHICAKNNLIDVSTHHIEQFAKGLISADVESRNELRLKEFSIQKVGKSLIVNHVKDQRLN